MSAKQRITDPGRPRVVPSLQEAKRAQAENELRLQAAAK